MPSRKQACLISQVALHRMVVMPRPTITASERRLVLHVMARPVSTRVTYLIFLRFINALRTVFRFGSVWISPAFMLAASWRRLGISWGSGVPFLGRMRCVHLVGLCGP